MIKEINFVINISILKMKKTNTQINNKLGAYSAMALAFMLAGNESHAEVIYTDVNPDETYDANGDAFEIDLNLDGYADFKIGIVSIINTGVFTTVSGASFSGLFRDIFVYPLNGAVAGSLGASSYAYPYALDAGAVIDASLAWQTNSYQSMVYYLAALDFPGPGSVSVYLNFGNWAGEQDKYLGLRLDIGADKFYGWARLDVEDNNHEFTIKDYAFQANIDQAITAGQSVDVYNVIQPAELTAYSFENKINIVVKDLKTAGATAKVFNMEGKVVFENPLDLSGMQIEINHPAGNYTLQIVTEENAVYTKQFFIQN